MKILRIILDIIITLGIGTLFTIFVYAILHISAQVTKMIFKERRR